MRVLALISYYLPGYKLGGPLQSVANMVEGLGDDLEFRIVTRDRDAGEEQPYREVSSGQWHNVGKGRVLYAAPGDLSLVKLARIIRRTPYDVLYLNSFFDPVFTIRPLVARQLGWLPNRPVVIAPRGEFSPGALELKAWKKVRYVNVARVLGLYRDLVWQATSDREAQDIERSMGSVVKRLVIAPNPPRIHTAAAAWQRPPEGPLRVVFVSRIDPMKNLDFALRVVSQVRSPLSLDIFGPARDQNYFQKCQAMMATLPEHIRATYHGGISPEDVPRTFAEHDLFLFPTRGENFGHVIFESLSVGTPVIISDQTPWHEDGGGGCVVIPLSQEAEYVETIERFATMSQQQRECARDAARGIARRYIEKEQLLVRTHELFLGALGRGQEA